MKQNQNIKTAVFVFFSLAGLLVAGFLVKKTLELRKGAAFGTITMGLYPSPVEICVGQTENIFVTINPVVNNEVYDISAAELRFTFNSSLATATSVNFHENYAQGMWNEATNANERNEIRFTALSNLSGDLPEQAFNLAQVALTGVEKGSLKLLLMLTIIK